ncbi:MAG: EamA family transporter [Chloroflexi bacterium]|nr:EamA family transporter [Chloroflexota bacterium]
MQRSIVLGHYAAYLRAALAATIWGSSGVFVRWANQSLWVLMAIPGLVGAVVLFEVCRRRGLLPRLRERAVQQVLAAFSLLGVLTTVTFILGLQLADIGPASFAHYVAPVLVVAAAPFVLRQPGHWRSWAALALALAGLGLMLTDQVGAAATDAAALGLLLAFLSAITYAAAVLIGARFATHVDPALISLSGATLMAGVGLPLSLSHLSELTPTAVGLLSVQGVTHVAVAMLLFYGALRVIPASHASILSYFEPLTAALLGAVLLAQPMSAAGGVGAAAIIAAGVMVLLAPGTRRPVRGGQTS